MQQGALDRELKGNSAEWSAIGTEMIPVFWAPSSWPAHSSSSATVWYADFKGFVSPVVPLLCRKVIPRIAPSFSHVLCFRALGYLRVAFLALEAGIVLPGRAVSENSCIRSSCLFGDGNIAYDRWFA